MAEEQIHKADMIFNCNKASIEVHLKVKGKYTKKLFGKKYSRQKVMSCGLHKQGGCTIKLEPEITSKCPAVEKAQKNSLKF